MNAWSFNKVPLDSTQHLEAARDHKQSKQEYLQVFSQGLTAVYKFL